jgi:8-oxo-dGTP pyrophosphatase MutT (NUDIX family)
MNLLLITTKIKSEYSLQEETVTRHPKCAAVLVILFISNNNAHVLMTKRSRHLKAHPGEICFPGGVMDADDNSLLDTALRETQEEIGLKLSASSVIGKLPLVHTLTGYRVTPFVTVLEEPPNLRGLSSEVEQVLEIPLAPLLATHQRDIGFEREKGMVVYLFKHHRIWGASAKILQQIEQLSVH